MERRRDYRHRLRYPLRVARAAGTGILEHVRTLDVSASGLRLHAPRPHGLERGEEVVVELRADLPGPGVGGSLHMATDGIVVRTGRRTAAVRFHGPLRY